MTKRAATWLAWGLAGSLRLGRSAIECLDGPFGGTFDLELSIVGTRAYEGFQT